MPSWLSAEHSRYLTAWIWRARAWPCWCVMGAWFCSFSFFSTHPRRCEDRSWSPPAGWARWDSGASPLGATCAWCSHRTVGWRWRSRWWRRWSEGRTACEGGRTPPGLPCPTDWGWRCGCPRWLGSCSCRTRWECTLWGTRRSCRRWAGRFFPLLRPPTTTHLMLCMIERWPLDFSSLQRKRQRSMLETTWQHSA